MSDRCTHFSLEIQQIMISDPPTPLRIPIRRCALAEHLIGVLMETEEGRPIARRILILGEALELEEVAEGETEGKRQYRGAFGPDLEPIHTLECTAIRCRESCTPGLHQLLRQFHMEEATAYPGVECSGLSAPGSEEV